VICTFEKSLHGSSLLPKPATGKKAFGAPNSAAAMAKWPILTEIGHFEIKTAERL
jgi:hypothetical protein